MERLADADGPDSDARRAEQERRERERCEVQRLAHLRREGAVVRAVRRQLLCELRPSSAPTPSEASRLAAASAGACSPVSHDSGIPSPPARPRERHHRATAVTVTTRAGERPVEAGEATHRHMRELVDEAVEADEPLAETVERRMRPTRDGGIVLTHDADGATKTPPPASVLCAFGLLCDDADDADEADGVPVCTDAVDAPSNAPSNATDRAPRHSHWALQLGVESDGRIAVAALRCTAAYAPRCARARATRARSRRARSGASRTRLPCATRARDVARGAHPDGACTARGGRRRLPHARRRARPSRTAAARRPQRAAAHCAAPPAPRAPCR